MPVNTENLRVRIAIVLPPGSLFCSHRPNSMETVVRTLLPFRSDAEEVAIFCDPGAQSYDVDVPVFAVGHSTPDKLLTALQSFDPDIVEFHQNVIGAARLAKHLPYARLVSYRHNALKPPKNPIDSLRYHRRYRHMDRFVFVSRSEQFRFMRDYPALQGRAVALTNPINAEGWLADIGERDRQIVFSGRAIPEKGVAEICKALPKVLDARPDWKAVLLLNDWAQHHTWAAPHVAPLRRYGERVKVMHSIPLGEVQQIMKRSDIALTPSLWAEPLGLTALEAHAAGAALISSGRGGLREASGPHALYVDDVTPDTLAQAMLQLIDDRPRRLAMAMAAQAYALDQHSPVRRSQELTRLRLELAGHPVREMSVAA